MISESVTSRSRHRVYALASTLLLVVAMTTCRSAAGVLLDLPEPAEETEADSADSNRAAQSAQRAQTRETRAPEDTVRPLIESAPTADSALALLPRHSSGGIDWVTALRDGSVLPRLEMPGRKARPEAPFGYDFYYGDMETYFPHTAHTAWMGCGSCHPAIFRGPGSARTSMKEIREGKSCGACHGPIAFGAEVCERCHTGLSMPANRLTPELTTDVVFVRDTTIGMEADFPPSIFPHWMHRVWYRCSACHPEPFAPERGATAISMGKIQAGEQCGACHNAQVAFGSLQCARCHRPPPEPVRAPPADSG